ncbi:hypothetical protein FGADI_12631 [Fusarium gaditjirri]|uniref:Uncharacterized protein n=1 Tax=Fusarium gaditjirri TaxID=282569 RepID=A0A8H4SRW1_9HYPO|nr:hypothetical protein FGADI_12631 [Fusarium gaditjirri]
MDTEFVGYGSIARQNRDLAEWHRNADYSIVHPTNNKIPWLGIGRVPEGLRVMETQAYTYHSTISVTCAAKYLSFASEADFLSYVDIVVPDIVGPAIDVMHSSHRDCKERINAYSNTPFAIHPSAQNQDLINHIQNQNILDVQLNSQAYRYKGDCPFEPRFLLKFFLQNAAVREWLATLAALLTEPKLIPTNVPTPPGAISAFEEEPFAELFMLTHAVQIMLFAPVCWREDGSYKSTDSYARRFPLGFPRPSPGDEKAFGEYTLDDFYRALVLQDFLFRQRYEGGKKRYKDPLSTVPPEAEAPWVGYSLGRSEPPWEENCEVTAADRSLIMKLPREIQFRIVELAASSPKVTPTLLDRPRVRPRYTNVQSTWEDSILALKLSSRIMYKLAIAVQNVEGVVDQRVAFRMNLDTDTLRVFDMRLPDFLTANGPSALPVRKLLSISKLSSGRNDYYDRVWDCPSPVGKVLDLEKLPKLDEVSLIFPSVGDSWMIENLPRVRPQTDSSEAAHIGIKWQFNIGLYPIDRWYGRYHDDHFNNSEKPYMKPLAPISNEARPYVGIWGYERSPGAVGGYWASFQYFEKTKEVYFSPLSWSEVEPLIKGPYEKNGREALYEDHTPRFVAKLRIIRHGTTAPSGWIKVENAGPNDPKWKGQLLNTWKSVWYTLVRRRFVTIDSPSLWGYTCDYYLRQK